VPAHARAGKERFLDALEAGGGAERDLEAAPTKVGPDSSARTAACSGLNA
jgi:hypothetical protein